MTPTPFPLTLKNENFIRSWTLTDTTICDRLIEFYKKSDRKEIGKIMSGDGVETVRTHVKDSTDIVFWPTDKDDVFLDYLVLLQEVVDEYVKLFPRCNSQAAWSVVDGVNIQHYGPGGGYKEWHCERHGVEYPIVSRHLVFMTYLNDVEQDGETEFYHQELKIKPVKGLTTIFPADWTYTHRGIPAMTEDKYIITGWFNYFKGNSVAFQTQK